MTRPVPLPKETKLLELVFELCSSYVAASQAEGTSLPRSGVGEKKPRVGDDLTEFDLCTGEAMFMCKVCLLS